MNSKDTPILLMSVQGIALALLSFFAYLSYATVMIVVILGALYLVWSIKE